MLEIFTYISDEQLGRNFLIFPITQLYPTACQTTCIYVYCFSTPHMPRIFAYYNL